MRAAGLVVARALRAMAPPSRRASRPATWTSSRAMCSTQEGATSSFLGYDIGNGPYPGVICAR